MPGLAETLQRFTRLGMDPALSAASDALRETAEFGPNPGGLRMLRLVPPGVGEGAALVVALHGCGQGASDYAVGSGWTELAVRHGFALLAPEQVRCNNANLCFNWFRPGDTARGVGEAASIHAMAAHMVARHRLDSRRVFVTGLSAGGAMAGALLAAYPETFAAGAVIAGLPFGAAASVQEAMAAMRQAPERDAVAWGALVRSASGHHGPWPLVQVWHGEQDSTVAPGNAGELVKQWRDVHGLPEAPSVETVVDGARHRVWRGRDGAPAVESFLVPGMGHGAPIAPRATEPDQRCGVAGPYVLDAGISSTARIASAWGLAGGVLRG